MKKSGLQKATAWLLASLLCVFAFGTAAAADTGGISSFCVAGCPDADTADAPTAVNWWHCAADGRYYIFLPSSADSENLTVRYTATAPVMVDGTALAEGVPVDVFAGGGSFTLTCGTATYPVVVLQSETLPVVYITTESGSLDAIHADKSHKESGYIRIVADGEDLYNGELSSIKGRGNATWLLDKRPYNIKLDKKTNLFGMGKAKSWCLLASHVDNTLLKNRYVYGLADEMGLAYSIGTQNVELFINNDYMGSYLLTEKVEIDEKRVDITDLEKANEDANEDIDIEECAPMGDGSTGAGYLAGARKWVDIPNNPAGITGGYLLEYELCGRFSPEVSGFVTSRIQPVVLKSPEYASKAQVDYIADYVQNMEDAVYSETGYNAQGEHYSAYLDMDSLVRMYCLQELAMNLDAGITSFYLYKEVGGKLFCGPAWDFDRALYTDILRFGLNYENPATFAVRLTPMYRYAAEGNRGGKTTERDAFSFLAALCMHDDFNRAAAECWNNTLLPAVSDRQSWWSGNSAALTSSAICNGIRWGIFGTTEPAAIAAGYGETVATVADFIDRRIAYLSPYMRTDGVFVRYSENGGVGFTVDPLAYAPGATATTAACKFTRSGYNFAGWNTARDGTGTAYAQNAPITLPQSVQLYAQWTPIPTIEPEPEPEPNFFERLFARIKAFFAQIAAFFNNLFA